MKVSTRFAIYISNYIYILHETEICYTITDPWVTEIVSCLLTRLNGYTNTYLPT